MQQVTVHKAVTDIWADLGLEEMPDEYLDSDVSGGPRSLMMRCLMMRVILMPQ